MRHKSRTQLVSAVLGAVCLSASLLAGPIHVACAQPPSTSIRLTNVTDQTGIRFNHTDGGTGQRTVVESVVAGMATFDGDNDGLVDIYFVNGLTLNAEMFHGSAAEKPTTHVLYRNLGSLNFSDVTQAARVSKAGYGMGAVAADYDQDGYLDLYVSNFGQNVLYRNCGDGTYVEVTRSSGIILPDKVGAGCAFLDIEGDGDLDLYVGSYVQFTLDQHRPKFVGQRQFHPGPTDYAPSADALFRNNGDGSFSNVSDQSGIAREPSYTMGIVAFDADQDGDTDIFLANDQRPNTLWINDGQGRFTNESLLAGVAVDRTGKPNGNMGVEIGDVNSDGLLDIFTTTYQDEMPVLYINLGGGQFMDQTNVLRVDNRLHPHVSWGCGLVDFDNDGDLDIYVACGHFMDNIQFIDDRTAVKVRDFILENRQGRFVDVSAVVGSGLEVIASSRAAAFEDFDNDGDLDVIVLNANASPVVIRNDTDAAIRGVTLQLVGTESNRSAIGARVRWETGTHQSVVEVVAGRGYQSHYSSRVHSAPQGDLPFSVTVSWPSGRLETFHLNGRSGTTVVTEGGGALTPTSF